MPYGPFCWAPSAQLPQPRYLAAYPPQTGTQYRPPYQTTSAQHRDFGSQERRFDDAYCLVDEKGFCRPFSNSRVSQLSGKTYEEVISQVFSSSPSRRLHAVLPQEAEERTRLLLSKEVVANFLQTTVSDSAAASMREKGIGEELAQVDTVYNGRFQDFADSIFPLSTPLVTATCEHVQSVLVEICSDSRFVAMKLYQIEIQSCLVARQGYLARDDTHGLESVLLQPDTTGFAIVFNRAALQIKTDELAVRLGLQNVSKLLEQKKLHIVYFQSESAVSAALIMAREAKNEVRELKEKHQGTGGAFLLW